MVILEMARMRRFCYTRGGVGENITIIIVIKSVPKNQGVEKKSVERSMGLYRDLLYKYMKKYSIRRERK